MATEYDLNTVSREDAGTSHSRRMRRDGMVPAVVYGAGKDSVKVSISHNELHKKKNKTGIHKKLKPGYVKNI